MTSFVLVALGLALIVAVLALGRELRLRKALEKLLRILLSQWRAHRSTNHHSGTVDIRTDPDTRL